MNRVSLLFLMLIGTRTFGQNTKDGEEKTLIGSLSEVQWGGMIGAGVHLADMAGEARALQQFSGAVIINHNFRLGGSYAFLYNDILLDEINGIERQDLYLASVDLEYVWRPNALVHLSFPLQVGMGEAEIENELDIDWIDDDEEYDEDVFGFIHPSVQLELNLHRFVRFHLGAGYRFVYEASLPGLDNDALSGFNGTVGLRFGLF